MDVVIVMCQYGRQVMPPDGVCPSFDECLDLGFRGSSALRHDPCSPRIADPCPEDERGFANPTRDLSFFESTGSGPSGPLQLLRPQIWGQTPMPAPILTSAPREFLEPLDQTLAPEAGQK